MPEQKIKNLGSGGVNVDTPSHQLPPNVFSDGLNLRFTSENKIRGSFKFKEEGDTLNNVKTIDVSYDEDGSSKLLTYDSEGGTVTAGDSDWQYANLKLGYDAKFKPTLIEFNNVVIINTGLNPPMYLDKTSGSLFPLENWNEDVNGPYEYLNEDDDDEVDNVPVYASYEVPYIEDANNNQIPQPLSINKAEENNYIARKMRPWGNRMITDGRRELRSRNYVLG